MPPGGDTPFNGLNREAAHERDTFFRLEVYEKVGIFFFFFKGRDFTR